MSEATRATAAAAPRGTRRVPVAIKVCGLTRPADAALAVELGATHLGLNFWPRSPRHVTAAVAREVIAAAPGAEAVGVFVNATADEIAATAVDAGLATVQLHGDEEPALGAALAARGLRVVRAVRGNAAAAALRSWEAAWGFLFEERHAAYGGSGEPWDWRRVAALADALAGRPWFLAGGLSPETIGAALTAASPWGVDVCSGVEAAPGLKDPDRLRRFFAEIAHHAEGPALAAT